MDPNRPIGKHTAAEVRGDEEATRALADITGLSEEEVRRVVGNARGATQVRNVFRDRWPWTATALGTRTVAFARGYDLKEELERLTGGTRTMVSRRLNAGAGRQHLRSLFWDCWPPDERSVAAPTEAEATSFEAAQTERVEPIEPQAMAEGTVLSSRYRLVRRLGQGGFGTTWKAHDRMTDLELVIKIPRADDGGAIRNELRQAFRITHPNICQAFPDRDDETGHPFLVMQDGGEDLQQRLEHSGNRPFPLTLAVHVLVSIADALDYLHDQGVLHLDVAPKNILIDPDDFVRLTDFGASSEAKLHVTETGHHTKLAAKLHSFNRCYGAPELFDGEGRGRSDQYSLFLVFCSLLEGTPRVQAANYHEPRSYDVLSEGQNQIVRRALSRDPAQRFDSCGEAARALADDMASVPGRVLATDIARLSEDFVRRVEVEQNRVSTGTVRLGGALKLGRGLERLLQATLLWLASLDQFDALAALKEHDQHATSLDRSTAGALVRTIAARAALSSNHHGPVAPLLADLGSKKTSRIWDLINARNDVIHGRRAAEAILPAAVAVSELLRLG